ncbi:MAG: hypothetical protein EA411_10140 [Saprospirales bacterium]|nr:MAG: hypothetical protein EA411_10140 [Saprospirales bacterium]
MEFSRQHSSYLLVVLVIAGISFLFLSLLASLLYLQFNQSVGSLNFPGWFVITTFFILALSYYAEGTKVAFREGDAGKYGQNLQFAMAAVLLFLLGQLRTWYDVISADAFMETNNAYAFLYLLSGLHLLHVIAAIPFMIYIYYRFRYNYREEHQLQLYFSDDSKYRQLDQLAIYIHFMGILWLVLLVSFLAMSMI